MELKPTLSTLSIISNAAGTSRLPTESSSTTPSLLVSRSCFPLLFDCKCPAVNSFCLHSLIITSRINKMHLVKEWKAEDWIMAAVIMVGTSPSSLCIMLTLWQPVYFALIILINVSARYATNLYPADQEADILSHPNNVADRILGSKIVIGLEQSMLLVTWGVKACLWIFMTRLW